MDWIYELHLRSGERYAQIHTHKYRDIDVDGTKLTLLKHMHVHIQVCKKIDSEIYIMSTTCKYEYNDS